MTHDPNQRQECERLYVEELLDPREIAEKTGVSLPTFYRWAKEFNWQASRENSLGLRDHLGKLLFRLIEEQVKPGNKIDSQKLFSLIKILEKYQRTGAIRERIVYFDDAEKLFGVLKEIEKLKPILDDPEVLAEIETKLKEKML